MSSARAKPRALASRSQRSSSKLPMPRRAFEGSTKNARIFAACVRGSSNEASRPARASPPKSVAR